VGLHHEECDYVNRAGSFLYEPAGSVHTLECLEDETNVWFQMYGANLNLDADGNIESVFDGPGTLAAYYALCEAAGLPKPKVLTE
jgi:2,4'-dihydroxyacetophenone dioxygenase